MSVTTLNPPLAGLKLSAKPVPGKPTMLLKLPGDVPVTLYNWNMSLVVNSVELFDKVHSSIVAVTGK